MEFWAGNYGMQRPAVHPRHPAKIYAELIEQAEVAEECGFASFCVTEHHFWYDGYCPSLLTTLAGIAARTSKIRVHTTALLLPMHDPLRVAEDAAMLDNLSNGRLELSIGMGYVPWEFEGLRWPKKTRGNRIVEAMEILRLAFTEERFSFESKHYRYDDVAVRPRPIQRPPRMWYAAGGVPSTAVRGGRHFLPYFAGPGADIESVTTCLEAYRKAAREAGHDPARQRYALIRDTVIAETREEAERILHEDLIPMYEEQIIGFGFITDEAGNPLRELSRDHPYYSKMLASFVVGTPDDVIRGLNEYRKLGFEYVMPRFISANWRPQRLIGEMRLFAKEVMPAFRN